MKLFIYSIIVALIITLLYTNKITCVQSFYLLVGNFIINMIFSSRHLNAVDWEKIICFCKWLQMVANDVVYMKMVANGWKYMKRMENKGVKMNKNRIIAMLWWAALNSAEKTRLCDINTNLIGKNRRWGSLTGNEIERIYFNGKK